MRAATKASGLLAVGAVAYDAVNNVKAVRAGELTRGQALANTARSALITGASVLVGVAVGAPSALGPARPR